MSTLAPDSGDECDGGEDFTTAYYLCSMKFTGTSTVIWAGTLMIGFVSTILCGCVTVSKMQVDGGGLSLTGI